MANQTYLRAAISIATTSAASAALYFLYCAQRERHLKRGENGPGKSPEDSDDDTQPTTTSVESPAPVDKVEALPKNSDDTCSSAAASDALAKPSSIRLRAVSTNTAKNTVVLRTDQGHTIEGTITSTDGTMINNLSKVNKETLAVAFMEEGTGKSALAQVDVQDIAITDSPPVTPKREVNIKKVKEASHEKRPSNHKHVASEAVIMISPDDLSMMFELLSQQEDGEELFDCRDMDKRDTGGRRSRRSRRNK